MGLQRLNARILLARANPLVEILMEPVDLDEGSREDEAVPGRVGEVCEALAVLEDAPSMVAAVRLSCAAGYLSGEDLLLLRAALPGIILPALSA